MISPSKPHSSAEKKYTGLILCKKERKFMRFENKNAVITVENICLNGGMSRLMLWHDEHGWEFRS